MGAGPKVTMVHKLKYEHIRLTSFSKMRVDLAAQVCISIFSLFVNSGSMFRYLVELYLMP